MIIKWTLRCALSLLAGAVSLVALGTLDRPPRPNASVRPSELPHRGSVGSSQARRVNSQTPVIDPVLVYSTLFGGSSIGLAGAAGSQTNFAQGITASFVDGTGNLYVAGATSAADFPVTTGVVQATNAQNNQVGFLAKLDPTGQTLLFSTYLFGMGSVSAIAQDPSGNIYVAGIAPMAGQTATSLPIPAGSTPFSSTAHSISVLKLNSTATTVLAATYFGGSGTDVLTGLVLDGSQNVYLTGTTTSNDFPTHAPIQSALGSSGQNGFVSEFNPGLSGLVYSSYFGGNSTVTSFASGTIVNGTRAHGIAVDASGDAYVVGQASSGFPTTSGAYQTTCTVNFNCAFFAKLNAGGSSILYATYLGGAGGFANAVAVDSSRNAYIGGGNAFSGFPEVNSLQSCTSSSGQANGFVSEFNSSEALTFSTCLGQTTAQQAQSLPLATNITDLVLDHSGNLDVIGAGAGSLPLQNPIQSNSSWSYLFVAAINPTTPSLLFSSYIEGGGPTLNYPNSPSSIAVDSSGNIFASGFSGTLGQTIPTWPIFNALQPGANLPNPNFPCLRCVATDGFIMKIAPTDAPAAAVLPGVLDFSQLQPTIPVGTSSTPAPVTIIDMGSASLMVSNATATGDFTIQNGCTSVTPAGGTCAIQVTFTPTAAGTRTGVLTIMDNSAGSPRTVKLTGQGGEAAVALSPASLSFAGQPLNSTSPAQVVTLTNSGALNLQVSQISVTGPFAETNTCGILVYSIGTCEISVTFTPTAAGSATGTLTITDSAADSPQKLALTGNTAAPGLGLAVASGSSATASVMAGGTAAYTLSIGGAGMSGTASLSCTGAPSGAVCSVPATESLNAATASSFAVNVSTTASGHVFYPVKPIPWLWPLTVGACLMLLQLFLYRRTDRLRWRFVPLMALVMLGCGGGTNSNSNAGSNSNATLAGTYTLVVTAKEGSTIQTQNLTLTVH
jgi:hypothetical protein